ncbi:lantibiotic dehydratase C-terminal domain-containing protein [Streptomyces corchorusii]|uniref:lantibiotic dehydratase C-terminal domain-containing protein n=1 Tax=Streptomyces corchorusii TaxID=1903 RepID=UPI003133B30B
MDASGGGGRRVRGVHGIRAGPRLLLHAQPPGLRARFRAAEPSGAEDLRAALLRRLDPGRQGGHSWARPVPGVYEPETYLFGGPRSMPWAHALFTADSRAVWASSAGSTVGSGRPYGRRPGAGCRAGSARRTGAGPPPVASAPGGCPPRPASGIPPLLGPGAPPLLR